MGKQSDLPDWLPQEAWSAFVEMRKSIRKPLTDYAKKLALNRLEQLRNSGSNPEEVLNQSILNDWQGLFPVKGSHNGTPQSSGWEEPDEAACEETAAFIRSIGAKATPDQRTWLKRWEASRVSVHKGDHTT